MTASGSKNPTRAPSVWLEHSWQYFSLFTRSKKSPNDCSGLYLYYFFD
jgi:hypothetical protein